MYKIDKIERQKKILKILGKTINILIYLILIPIILYNFILMIKMVINPNEVPEFLGTKTFVIISGSMEPTIHVKDVIVVKETDETDIEVGDIISFKQEEEVITHRIVDILEENGIKKYTTKGDNNNLADKEKITYDDIEGKFQFKIENFGVLIGILQNKVTLVLLITLIIINYYFTSRLNEKKALRKEKRKMYKLKQIEDGKEKDDK